MRHTNSISRDKMALRAIKEEPQLRITIRICRDPKALENPRANYSALSARVPEPQYPTFKFLHSVPKEPATQRQPIHNTLINPNHGKKREETFPASD